MFDVPMPSTFPVPEGFQRTTWDELSNDDLKTVPAGQEVYLLVLQAHEQVVTGTAASGPYYTVGKRHWLRPEEPGMPRVCELGDSRLLVKCPAANFTSNDNYPEEDR